jgi:hypothetical protein
MPLARGEYNCPYCGGHMHGDGFTEVEHCENVYIDPTDAPECDAEAVYCNGLGAVEYSVSKGYVILENEFFSEK